MRAFIFSLTALFGALLAGCGSYAITYATNPIGANIVCNGQNKGYSPVTLYYDTDGIGEDGILHTVGCEAHFVSGYRAAFSTAWDTNKFPDGVMQTHTRPHGEGYDRDAAFGAQYGMHLEQQRILKQQLATQQRMLQTQEDTLNQQKQWQQKPVFCTRVLDSVICN